MWLITVREHRCEVGAQFAEGRVVTFSTELTPTQGLLALEAYRQDYLMQHPGMRLEFALLGLQEVALSVPAEVLVKFGCRTVEHMRVVRYLYP